MADVAIGARSQITYIEESSWGTTPGSPEMRTVRVTGGTLTPGRSLVESSEFIADRSTPAPVQGAPFPALSLNVEMQAQSLGTFLKHLSTDTTTVVQTTFAGTASLASGANVNGLDLVVEDSGAGATTVTFSGSDPINANTIAAQINTAVGTDIATIVSNLLTMLPSSAGTGGYVRVHGGDASALTNLGLVARTEWNYTRLKASQTLPQGMSIEVGFTDISLYTVFKGSKCNAWSIDVSPNALVTGTFDFLCREGGEDYSASPLDATPTESFTDKFDTFNGELLVDGAVEARLRSFSLQATNNMQEDFQTVYTAIRDSLPEGRRSVSGSMGVKFDNSDFIDRAKNFTSTAITVKMENTSASSSGLNRFIRIILPTTRVQLPNFDIPEGAVDLPLDFIAHRDDTTELTDMIIEVGSGEDI